MAAVPRSAAAPPPSAALWGMIATPAPELRVAQLGPTLAHPLSVGAAATLVTIALQQTAALVEAWAMVIRACTRQQRQRKL